MDIVAPSVRQLADIADMERLQRIHRAWEHYDGVAPQPLRVTPGAPDDNVRLVYAQPCVDKGAFYLFGKGGGAQPQIDDAATLEKLEDAWPGRQLAHLKLATNGGVAGHAWCKITLPQPRQPRVVVLDPSNVTVTLGEDDIETAESYCIQWTVIDPTTGDGKARRQRIEPLGAVWEVIDEQSAGDGSWVIIGQQTWPFDWPPIFGAQNRPAPNEYYGRSDLEPAVLDLVEAIESVMSNANRIARLLGHPLVHTSGVTAQTLQQLDTSIGNVLTLPAEASIGMLEMQSRLEAHIALYERYRDALREITFIPEVTSGKLENAGPLSGVALSILYGPLIELTEVKRLTYGPLVSELDRRMLQLVTGTDPGVIGTTWPEVTPEDVQAETAALEADQRLGIVSKQTLAEKRGYDWEVEGPRLQDEAQASAEVMQKAFGAGNVQGGNPYDPQAQDQ